MEQNVWKRCVLMGTYQIYTVSRQGEKAGGNENKNINFHFIQDIMKV